MAVGRSIRQKWIEVWIELTVNYGHVELKVANSFWGFWPDDSEKREKVPGTKKNQENDPNYPAAKGGYYGRLEPRSKTELAYEYTDRLWGEAPLLGKKVPFHRFRFRTDNDSVVCLRMFMKHLRNAKLEYDVFNKGKARNCVGLALEILRECQIINECFKFRKGIPNPADMLNQLITLSGNSANIKYDLKWLEPPRFT